MYDQFLEKWAIEVEGYYFLLTMNGMKQLYWDM
jgi:hypothetical protein